MPRQPAYQSRPSSRIGRQACAAIERRISSVISSPWVAANSFSASSSSASSRSLGVCGRNASRAVARRHSASSIWCRASTRRRRQSLSQPMGGNSLFVKYRMVSVVQLHPQSGAAALGSLADGLAPADRARLAQAVAFAEPLYAGQVLSTGEPTWAHALGVAANLAAIGLDAPGRMAGVLFAAPKQVDLEAIQAKFGDEVASLASGVEKLYQLRMATRAS